MKGLLKFAAAVVILAFLFFKLRQEAFSRDGKILGVVEDGDGFGGYELVAGAILAGGLFAGAQALKMAKLGKFAPAAQGPTSAAA